MGSQVLGIGPSKRKEMVMVGMLTDLQPQLPESTIGEGFFVEEDLGGESEC